MDVAVNEDEPCSQCAPDYYGTDCSILCTRDDSGSTDNNYHHCNSHGICGQNGQSCTCDDVDNDGDVDYVGPQCEFSRSETCSGHGTPDSVGNCTCDIEWTDNGTEKCSQCAPDYYGADCSILCTSEYRENSDYHCNGRGTCGQNGQSCTCDDEWVGANCSQPR